MGKGGVSRSKGLMTLLLFGRETGDRMGQGVQEDNQAVESKEKRWAVNKSANEWWSHKHTMLGTQKA